MYRSAGFRGVSRWARYIDDIIFLWHGSEQDCLSFILSLNENPFNIVLTAHISNVQIEFLDLTLKLTDERIVTSLHRKPTATNSLLQFKSFHPEHLKRGIPYGQYIRLRRNCTEFADYKKHADDLTSRFLARGYPRKLLIRAYQKALRMERSKLLEPRQRTNTQELRFVTTYNNQWSDIRNLLNRNWHILGSDNRLSPFLPRTPLLTARRAPNLGDQLTRSHFVRPSRPIGRGTKLVGSYPCGECNICQYMEPTKVFTNPRDGSTVTLGDYINCRTKGVIYCLKCPCSLIYIGQTIQCLKQRVQKHLSTIGLAARDRRQQKKLTSVAEHFLDVHQGKIAGLKIYGLERAHGNGRGGDIVPHLLRRESRWIYEANSLTPHGLNAELTFTGFLQ